MAEHWCVECGHVWVEKKDEKCPWCKERERAQRFTDYVEKNEAGDRGKRLVVNNERRKQER